MTNSSRRTEGISVLLVDDHSLIRAGVRQILSAESDMSIVGEAESGQEAVELHRREQPTVTLLDLRLRGVMDGVEVVKKIRSEFPRARIVLLTSYPQEKAAIEGMQNGAVACVGKDQPNRDLVEAVRHAAAQRIRTPVLPRSAMNSTKPSVIERVLRSTESLLADPLKGVSIRELAREASLSVSQFVRLFKWWTGLPPHRYQLQCRVIRAMELLRSQPALSLAEVAYRCGFSDQSHLTRHFKRLKGFTPGAYIATLKRATAKDQGGKAAN